MTIKEKAKEIVLDHEAKRKRGLKHPLGYYIGAAFWIEISEMPEKANHFDVKLIDEMEEGPDVLVDDRIETRETIIDAVEQYLHDTLWDEEA